MRAVCWKMGTPTDQTILMLTKAAANRDTLHRTVSRTDFALYPVDVFGLF